MSWDNLQSLVLGGLGGGGVSYIANLVQWRRIERDRIIDLTQEIDSDIAVYWGSTGSDETLERRIIKLNRKVSSKCKAYGRKYLNQHQMLQLSRLSINLSKISTGSDFQGRNRKKDPDVIDESEKILDDLRELLSCSWVVGTLRRIGRFGR